MFIESNIDLFSTEGLGAPLLFEIVPPEKGKKENRLEKHTHYLERLFQETTVNALNIPEIQDESKKGNKGKRRKPHKERVSPRKYAAALSERFDTEFVINRVVVKHSKEEQENWLLETNHEFGLKNVILVGGESSDEEYPGLSVPAGNQLATRYLNQGRCRFSDRSAQPTDVTIGNICIPTRRKQEFDEPERMLKKYDAGADFFTTQIIAEAESPISLLNDLSAILEKEDKSPPFIFWSFSPISEKKDVDFQRWLGVHIPEEIESRILGSRDSASASIEWGLSVWEKIQDFNDRLPTPFPMGINISIMGLRNFDHGIRLARELNMVGIPD
ncbi:MAG: methylenetetrahydrofolate reductase [Balneolaceae bacterium]